MPKRFRFGLTLFPVMSERQVWIDEVKRAESAGFSAITVSDHFRSSGGIWPSLITAAEVAPSLRVGTIVLNNDFWHPVLVAREAITAQVLTEGRFELGIGAGWDELDYRAMGLKRQPAARRIERLGEAIAILSQALAGRPIRFAGAHYRVDGGDPWPASPTPIPLLVGGGGRRILELAARCADIVSLHRNLEHGLAASWAAEGRDHGPFDSGMSERVSWVRSSAGERFEQLELHALLLKAVVTDHRLRVAAELGRPIGFSAEQILASPHYLVGTVEEMVADLRERRSRWGISYWTLVAGNDVEAFAPVVAALAGT